MRSGLPAWVPQIPAAFLAKPSSQRVLAALAQGLGVCAAARAAGVTEGTARKVQRLRPAGAAVPPASAAAPRPRDARTLVALQRHAAAMVQRAFPAEGWTCACQVAEETATLGMCHAGGQGVLLVIGVDHLRFWRHRAHVLLPTVALERVMGEPCPVWLIVYDVAHATAYPVALAAALAALRPGWRARLTVPLSLDDTQRLDHASIAGIEAQIAMV